MKHGSPVNLAFAPLPPSSCNTTIPLTIRMAIRLQLFLTFFISISSQMFFTFLFLDTIVLYASFLELVFLYLGARVETGSCRAHSLTLSMPLSPPHKDYYLLCMHAAGSWRLEGPGRWERAPEAVRPPAWPTSHYHHIFLGVRARQAGDLFSLPRFSLLSGRPPSD